MVTVSERVGFTKIFYIFCHLVIQDMFSLQQSRGHEHYFCGLGSGHMRHTKPQTEHTESALWSRTRRNESQTAVHVMEWSPMWTKQLRELSHHRSSGAKPITSKLRSFLEYRFPDHTLDLIHPHLLEWGLQICTFQKFYR